MIQIPFTKLFKSNKFRDPSLNKDCTNFEVDLNTISEFIVSKLIPLVATSPFPLDELVLLVSAVCRLKPTHIFEWGTHVGKSARIFYETTKYFKINTRIISIDLPDDEIHIEHPGNQRGLLVKGIKEVELYQGDGLNKSLELYKNIISSNRNISPLFFLDGDHEFQSVKRELEGIINNVKNPSILIHDTFFQSKKSGYNIGPSRAVQEIILKNPKPFKIINCNLGLPGMILLYNL